MDLGQTLLSNQDKLILMVEQLQAQVRSLQQQVYTMGEARQFKLNLDDEVPGDDEPLICLENPVHNHQVKIRCKKLKSWDELDAASKIIYGRNVEHYDENRRIFDQAFGMLNLGYSLEDIYADNQVIFNSIGISRAKGIQHIIVSLRQLNRLRVSNGLYVLAD